MTPVVHAPWLINKCAGNSGLLLKTLICLPAVVDLLCKLFDEKAARLQVLDYLSIEHKLRGMIKRMFSKRGRLWMDGLDYYW